jgi:Spy/CpxP family protein refolding chaperone
MQQGQGMQQGMAHYIANFGMLLHHKADLALTDQQVQRIEALQKQAQTDCEQHMKMAHDQHAAAAAALNAATPDVAGFEAKLREASQHMVQAHVAVARRGVEALGVLTAAQKTKLQSGKHDSH